MLAASTALAISPIPWDGPIAAVRVGQVEGNWILNPTFQQLEFSTIDLFVTGSADSIVMVEGGALEISEKEVLDALKIGQKGIKELIGIAQKVISKAAKPTMAWVKAERDAALTKRVEELAEKAMAKAINAKDKAGRAEGVAKVKASVVEQLLAEFPDQGRTIGNEIEEVEYRVMRAQVLDKGERVDGRDTDTVRPITHRDQPAAARARLVALHPRPDAGAGGRDPRHRGRRAAHRQHRRGRARRPSRSCSTTTSRRTAPARSR